MFPISNNVQSPDNAFLHIIITLITGRAAELQLGPAEAAVSMTKKILAMTPPDASDTTAVLRFHNTLSRYVAIKEEQAEQTKRELLILWTDYFKPPHLQDFPDLHDTFWKAAKLCSTCKVEVNQQHADELLDAVKNIHDIFWKSKSRSVDWVLAGG